MENMKNDTTPKWKEMAQQLKVDCVRSEILEECTRRVRTVGSNAGNIQEKISDALCGTEQTRLWHWSWN